MRMSVVFHRYGKNEWVVTSKVFWAMFGIQQVSNFCLWRANCYNHHHCQYYSYDCSANGPQKWEWVKTDSYHRPCRSKQLCPPASHKNLFGAHSSVSVSGAAAFTPAVIGGSVLQEAKKWHTSPSREQWVSVSESWMWLSIGIVTHEMKSVLYTPPPAVWPWAAYCFSLDPSFLSKWLYWGRDHD